MEEVWCCSGFGVYIEYEPSWGEEGTEAVGMRGAYGLKEENHST